jgi:hypothetical protein
MNGQTEQLQTWWNGLSGTERVAALRARQTGRLDEGTRMSLEKAGVVQPGNTSGDDDVIDFLKTRHD